jgi:hypothetical protein
MRIVLVAACACLLAACSSDDGGLNGPVPASTVGNAGDDGGSWWWPFGGGDDEAPVVWDGPELGVNAYLWRATLDTLNFMPLATSDPVGGVINTEWYSPPENPNERVKVTAYILDRRLRADALRVSVFRQVQQNNEWLDAQVNPETPLRLENAILTRAREIHISIVQ